MYETAFAARLVLHGNERPKLTTPPVSVIQKLAWWL
jgi:hypothetical protein